MKRLMHICGPTGAKVQTATYVCKFCTDRGIPEGYIERQEWGMSKVKREKQIRCPDCKRYVFFGQAKRPHGSCSIETNMLRTKFRNRFGA